MVQFYTRLHGREEFGARSDLRFSWVEMGVGWEGMACEQVRRRRSESGFVHRLTALQSLVRCFEWRSLLYPSHGKF